LQQNISLRHGKRKADAFLFSWRKVRLAGNLELPRVHALSLLFGVAKGRKPKKQGAFYKATRAPTLCYLQQNISLRHGKRKADAFLFVFL
jgi:hypothetical protein